MRPEHWLFTIPLRLRSLFRCAQADQELDDELRGHLEQRTKEYLARGMAPEEAGRRARLDLGGIEQTKEKCRDARRVNWIQDLIQDIRYGLRTLRKSPSFTAVTVLTLALSRGIQDLRDGFSVPNFTDLIVIQSDELVKKLGRFDRVVRCWSSSCAQREEKYGEQNWVASSFTHERILH